MVSFVSEADTPGMPFILKQRLFWFLKLRDHESALIEERNAKDVKAYCSNIANFCHKSKLQFVFRFQEL